MTSVASKPSDMSDADLDSEISVVMITMNEEKAVGKVIADIRAAVPRAEILIVDSSKDATAEIARSMGAEVIRQFPPRGYGRAIDLALRSFKGSVAVTMDCDDTYPVDQIRPMARMVLRDSWDLVDGSRLERKPEAMPWLNYFANWGFALIASMFFWRRLTDLHSGMRAYRRGVIETLGYDPVGAGLPVEILLRAVRKGFRVRSVFIDYRERIGTSTMKPLQGAYWTARRILTARFGRI